MFKTVTISFRTKQELLEWLDRISQESGCSRSSLIEAVLRNFLNGKNRSGVQVESRVEIKGVEPLADEAEPHEGITYVTVGDVRVGLPKKRQCRISFDEKQSLFQLDFAADHDSKSEGLPFPEKERDHGWNSGMGTGT
jgi:hypothetical protein